MNNQIDIKAYVQKHYQSIKYETTYGLRRLLIELPMEQYGLDESSMKYQLITEQIGMAKAELEVRLGRRNA